MLIINTHKHSPHNPVSVSLRNPEFWNGIKYEVLSEGIQKCKRFTVFFHVKVRGSGSWQRELCSRIPGEDLHFWDRGETTQVSTVSKNKQLLEKPENLIIGVVAIIWGNWWKIMFLYLILDHLRFTGTRNSLINFHQWENQCSWPLCQYWVIWNRYERMKWDIAFFLSHALI